MPKPSGADMEAAVEAAISLQGGMPLGWFLVYENLDEDGERVLHYLAPDSLAYWQGLGMLYTAIDSLGDILSGGETDDE